MVLLYEESDGKASYMIDLLRRLRAAGHDAVFAEKTMRGLGMDVKRIARFAEGIKGGFIFWFDLGNGSFLSAARSFWKREAPLFTPVYKVYTMAPEMRFPIQQRRRRRKRRKIEFLFSRMEPILYIGEKGL